MLWSDRRGVRNDLPHENMTVKETASRNLPVSV